MMVTQISVSIQCIQNGQKKKKYILDSGHELKKVANQGELWANYSNENKDNILFSSMVF